MEWAIILKGFSFGAALIVAIGAQNAFVLKLGLLRRHVFLVALFCACSDLFLMVLGALGVGELVAHSGGLFRYIALGGAAFLLWYGFSAFMRALKPTALSAAGGDASISLGRALATVAALTYLNPHVYLDTVVLFGSISGAYPWPQRAFFVGGDALASFVWFFGLGYGARLLDPLFRKPLAWQILDLTIAVVMAAIAFSLLREAF